MTHYIGRFAPSPSGPLHFGSLVCALASFLDAKKNRGKWLVRIEDIDPPREAPGAADSILHTLAVHQLHWDDTPSYQSKHSHTYTLRLKELTRSNLAYPCNCVRKRLNLLDGPYDKHCLHQPPSKNAACSLRLNVELALDMLTLESIQSFDDRLQGHIRQNLKEDGDFVIHRKDGLFAYQLAVVSDDITQGITHIVRGCDLLQTSLQQILLHRIFDTLAPNYMHTPLITDESGRKLSKQNHAPAIDNTKPIDNLLLALKALGIHVSPDHNDPNTLLAQATEQWPPTLLNGLKEINYAKLLES